MTDLTIVETVIASTFATVGIVAMIIQEVCDKKQRQRKS